MNKLNVGIIFGGQSSEHEVSRRSAISIIKNLSEEKYNLYLIGITKAGKWLLFSGNRDDIANGRWENDNNNRSAFISPDASVGGVVILNKNYNEIIKLDIVFPVLHGKYGEDGTIQGIFEMAQIPFVGCGTTASAVCMDKVITNTLLAANGIKKAEFHWFYSHEFENNPEKCISDTEKVIESYPMFVKPANAGSSVGISKIYNKTELIEGIKKAAKEDRKILIEKAINGQEIECSVLGNDDPIVSIPGEIVPSNEFYDYEAKYISDSSELHLTARIPKETLEAIQRIAIQAYKILGCQGLARVDFLVEKGTNKIYLNEPNTLPGFTTISMYPKMLENSGISYPEILDRLIQLALNK